MAKKKNPSAATNIAAANAANAANAVKSTGGGGGGGAQQEQQKKVSQNQNQQKKKKKEIHQHQHEGKKKEQPKGNEKHEQQPRQKEGILLRVLWWIPIVVLLLYLLPSGVQPVLEDVSFLDEIPPRQFDAICSNLRRTSQATLDELYDSGLPTLYTLRGKEAKLCIIGMPGLVPFNEWIHEQLNKVWRAKIFSNNGSEMINDVAGYRVSKGAVTVSNSWYDGTRTIAIDYWKTDYVLKLLHDEVRMVRPNLYVGRTYLVTPFGKRFFSNLALSTA